jgi:hypothetical protein
MKIDTWTGCYPSNWKGKIVPDAITTPGQILIETDPQDL